MFVCWLVIQLMSRHQSALAYAIAKAEVEELGPGGTAEHDTLVHRLDTNDIRTGCIQLKPLKICLVQEFWDRDLWPSSAKDACTASHIVSFMYVSLFVQSTRSSQGRVADMVMVCFNFRCCCIRQSSALGLTFHL